MKEPKKRLRQTIALAIIFLILYSGILLYIEERQYNDIVMKDSAYKTELVRSMIEGYEKTADEIGSGFFQDEYARVRLMAIRLADRTANGKFTGDRNFDRGMVVLVRDGKIELPAEAEGLFSALTPEMITNEYAHTRTAMNTPFGDEAQGTGEVLLTSGRIAGDWYYVSWVPVEEYEEYIASHLSVEELLEAQEFDNDTEVFVVQAETGTSDSGSPKADEGTIVYRTGGLSKYCAIEDLGITREDLQKDSFTISTGKNKKYICIPISVESLGCIFVCCNSVEGVNAAFLGDTITQILLVAAMLTGLVTWCFSVQWLIGGESTKEQKKKYTPEAVKKRTTRLTIMSTAVVTFFAFLTVMMQCMYQEYRIGISALSLLRLQAEKAEIEDYEEYVPETERYERLGRTVSEMLSEKPALLAREDLSMIADAIEADYIIVFDENGKETACSRAYTGFDLPEDPGNAFYEFRKLLRGIDVITRDRLRDFITEDIRPFVGVRCDLPADNANGAERSGAVLIALPSRNTAEEKAREDIVNEAKQQVYRSIQTRERLIIESDPKTNRILSCSDSGYVGSDIEGLGMDPKALMDRHMGFYRFDDEWYFGVTKSSESVMYHHLTDSTGMSRAGILFALISGGFFLIGYLLLSAFALKEYDEENCERYASGIAQSADKYLEKFEKKAPSMIPAAVRWRAMSPEEKTKVVLQIETGVLMAVLILIALGNTPLSKHSALSFAIKGNWSKGFNLFSVIAVSVVCCIGYLIFLILKAVSDMLRDVSDPEGDTVIGLIQSFLNYVILIGTICMSLSYFGIDTTTLLASLGILSLAISLGAKDMVTDIIAGLSIILEKTYQVGDYIQVGDFKGKVMEIGVRSTRIINGTHDVKTISNHEISNVINYSLKTSVCVVKIRVPVTVSMNEIKDLFEKELPQVGKINPHIISGPKFEGILDFDNDRMIIGVSAEGPEEYIYRIRLDLNRALQSMAERQLLQYAQSNITIKVEGK